MADEGGWAFVLKSSDRATVEPCLDSLTTFDEACDMVAEYYEGLARQWRMQSSVDALYYREAD